MSYYDTIEEDLARAKEILEKGRTDVSLVQNLGGEAVYASDIYATYKLLESFVTEVERLQKLLAANVAIIEQDQRDADEIRTHIAAAAREHQRLRVELDDQKAYTQDFMRQVRGLQAQKETLRAVVQTDEETLSHNLATIERLRALVDAVGEDVCTTALRQQQRRQP